MKPERPADRMMAVLAMSGLSATERLVLGAIAFHDGPGGARPTAATLGTECGGMAASTVRGHIAKMVARGVLTKKKGQRGDSYSIAYEWRSDRSVTEHSENLSPGPQRCPDRSVTEHSDPPRRGAQTARSPDARPLGDRALNRKEPEGTPSAPPRAEGVPSPSTAREAAAPPGRSPPEGQRPSGATVADHPPPPDPDAPPWQLPLVRTIEGGRAAETPKEGMQEDGAAADVEATLDRLRSGTSGGQTAKRLDEALANLGENILSKQGSRRAG